MYFLQTVQIIAVWTDGRDLEEFTDFLCGERKLFGVAKERYMENFGEVLHLKTQSLPICQSLLDCIMKGLVTRLCTQLGMGMVSNVVKCMGL